MLLTLILQPRSIEEILRSTAELQSQNAKAQAFMFIVIGGVWWVGQALFVGKVAQEKGYGFWGWFIGGLLFPLVALIAAAGLPDRAKPL